MILAGFTSWEHSIGSPYVAPVVIDETGDQARVSVGEGVLVGDSQQTVDRPSLTVVTKDPVAKDWLGAAVLRRNPGPVQRLLVSVSQHATCALCKLLQYLSS